MKKKNDLYRKISNKKLALNKQKISELSQGNLGDVKGGRKPGSWGKLCVKETFGWACEWESELYTVCHCEKSDWGYCGVSTFCEKE